MGLRGDFGKLRSLIVKMRAAAGGGLTKADSPLMQQAKAALEAEVALCFKGQRAPGGTPWAPRKTKYGTYRDYLPILYDLYSSLVFIAEDGRVRVESKKYYTFYHDAGLRPNPQRQFIPSKTTPGRLPERIKLVAAAAVRGALSMSGLGRLLDLALHGVERVSGAIADAADDQVSSDKRQR